MHSIRMCAFKIVFAVCMCLLLASSPSLAQEQIGFADLLPDEIEVFQENIAASPTSDVFAINTTAKQIILWDANRHEIVLTFAGEWELRCGTLIWSPDGRYLAAKDLENLLVWDAQNGDLLYRTYANPALYDDCFSPGHPVFSPDGTTLAMSAHNDEGIALWNIVTGHYQELSTKGTFYQIKYSPDSQFVAAGGGYLILPMTVWNTTSGEPVYAENSATALAFSPDGTMLAVGVVERPFLRLRLLNTQTLTEIQSLLLRTAMIVGQIEWLPDNQSMLIGLNEGLTVSEGFQNGPSVIRWDIHQNEIVNHYEDKRDIVIGYQPVEDEVLWQFESFTLPCWGIFFNQTTGDYYPIEFSTDTLTTVSVTSNPIDFFALNPDGTALATVAWWDNEVIIWDVATERQIFSFRLGGNFLSGIIWLQDGQHLICIR